MMGAISRFFIVATLVLAATLMASLRHGAGLRREAQRLEQNQAALVRECRFYKVRDSLNAASVGVLTLKAEEFRRSFEALSRAAHELGIRVGRLESLSQTATESRYEITAAARDTVVVRGGTGPRGGADHGGGTDAGVESGPATAPMVGKAISYHSAYIEMDGILAGGEFSGTIVTFDTLTQVVHRVPRRFLFIRYGTRELRQEIVSSNPHTRITYTRALKISR